MRESKARSFVQRTNQNRFGFDSSFREVANQRGIRRGVSHAHTYLPYPHNLCREHIPTLFNPGKCGQTFCECLGSGLLGSVQLARVRNAVRNPGSQMLSSARGNIDTWVFLGLTTTPTYWSITCFPLAGRLCSSVAVARCAAAEISSQSKPCLSFHWVQ